MSRRSPDREKSRNWDRDLDRDRDQGSRAEHGNYRSSASASYRPRQSYREDELEAGQVRTGWSSSRDPRRSENHGDRRSARPRSREGRSREASPALSTDKDVRAALEIFSKAMHATLLSTSTHALASQHLRRMESFPHTSSGSTVSSVEAQNRLRDAEVELSQKTRDLHGAFEKLMKRTLSLAPDNDRDRDRDRDRSRNEDREKGRVRSRSRSRAEVDQVPEKTIIIDRKTDTPQSPSRKGKEKAIPSNPEEGEEEGETGKRSRARLLLEEIVKRLEVVEEMKENLDDRCENLEDLVHAKVQDEMEIERMGNMKWRVVEELRDPDGVIRCLKRKRKLDREEFMMEPGTQSQSVIVPPPPVDIPPPPPVDTGNTDVIAQLQQQVAAMEKDRSEIAKLKELVESLQSDRTKASTEPKPDPKNVELQQQVDALRAELEEMKKYRVDRDQTLIDEVSANVKGFCSEVVVNQILNSVKAMANQSKPSNFISNARTSPSVSPAARLVSIPQGSVSPTVPKTILTESPAPPKTSVEQDSGVGSAPLHSNAPLSQNGSAGQPSHAQGKSPGGGNTNLQPVQSIHSGSPTNSISRPQQAIPQRPSTSPHVNTHLLPKQRSPRTASTSYSTPRPLPQQYQHQMTAPIPHYPLQIPFHFGQGPPGYQPSIPDHAVPLGPQAQWSYPTPFSQPGFQNSNSNNPNSNHNPLLQIVQAHQPAGQYRQMPSDPSQIPGAKPPSKPAGQGS